MIRILHHKILAHLILAEDLGFNVNRVFCIREKIREQLYATVLKKCIAHDILAIFIYYNYSGKNEPGGGYSHALHLFEM